MIPDYVLKDAPWSISKIGTVEKCSEQFHYKYRLKIKEQVTFNNSLLGKAVHRALELALTGKITVSVAFNMSRLEFELTTNETEQLYTFRQQVTQFVAKMEAFKIKHGVREVLLEKKIGLRTDFTGTEFFDNKGLLRGVIDYALITHDGYIIIIDHKTGKERDISEYEAQFKSYCLLAKANYPFLKGVQTAINFVLTDNLVWGKMVLADQIEKEYQPWLLKYLADTCEPLTRPHEPKKSSACDWCPYGPKGANTAVCTLYGGTGQVPVDAEE